MQSKIKKNAYMQSKKGRESFNNFPSALSSLNNQPGQIDLKSLRKNMMELSNCVIDGTITSKNKTKVSIEQSNNKID
jgi:hypothetical protein